MLSRNVWMMSGVKEKANEEGMQFIYLLHIVAHY